LRDIGKHFTVNELIKKDAIATRLANETGLSYTEFAYPLLQAYDYLTLYRAKGCTLQVGGSDQWGNMVAGIDLIRRVEQGVAHVVTVPLVIDKTTGKKFGKSEGNAVWLAAEKTTPYAFYQFWFNVSDENVIAFLKLFTLLPLEEIARLETELETNPGSRIAQKTLAREVTTLVHGLDLALSVEKVANCLFGETPISELTFEEKATLLANAPVCEISEGSPLLEVLVESGLALSKREARTFVESGAVYVNGDKTLDLEFLLNQEKDGELIHLRRGKKQVAVIKIN
jgi:tyrosyl-tRNA synthetase